MVLFLPDELIGRKGMVYLGVEAEIRVAQVLQRIVVVLFDELIELFDDSFVFFRGHGCAPCWVVVVRIRVSFREVCIDANPYSSYKVKHFSCDVVPCTSER